MIRSKLIWDLYQIVINGKHPSFFQTTDIETPEVKRCHFRKEERKKFNNLMNELVQRYWTESKDRDNDPGKFGGNQQQNHFENNSSGERRKGSSGSPMRRGTGSFSNLASLSGHYVDQSSMWWTLIDENKNTKKAVIALRPWRAWVQFHILGNQIWIIW